MKYLKRFRKLYELKDDISSDLVLDVTDIFTDAILDEVDMTNLPSKNHYLQGEDNIHDVWPEFTGQTFYSIYMNYDLPENKQYITVVIKVGKYIHTGDSHLNVSDILNKIQVGISNFRKRLESIGLKSSTSTVTEEEDYHPIDDVVIYTINISE